MEKVGLNITPKEFKQLSKWAEDIYNTAVVIDYFVANQPEIEECSDDIYNLVFKAGGAEGAGYFFDKFKVGHNLSP